MAKEQAITSSNKPRDNGSQKAPSKESANMAANAATANATADEEPTTGTTAKPAPGAAVANALKTQAAVEAAEREFQAACAVLGTVLGGPDRYDFAYKGTNYKLAVSVSRDGTHTQTWSLATRKVVDLAD